MTEILSAGIAQDRAPASTHAGGEVSNPLPRSTVHDRLSWELGRGDGAAGRPWRVGPDEILARTFDGDRDVLSYLVGYRAGELDRARGGVHAAAL